MNQYNDIINEMASLSFFAGEEIIKSSHGLLTTIAYQVEGEKPLYALEGSVPIAGAAVQWLRDSLKVIKTAQETEIFYSKSDQSQKIYFVPAFVGLGAPYWDGEARGAIFGMTRNTGIAEFVKAAIDSIAYQTKDLVIAMQKDSGVPIKQLKVEGGMVAKEDFLEYLSNILILNCDRPKITETTALLSLIHI